MITPDATVHRRPGPANQLLVATHLSTDRRGAGIQSACKIILI